MKRLLVALQCAIPRSRRLWLGLSISYLGDQFTIIALLWFVLQLIGSGAAVGLVILCSTSPASSSGRSCGVCWNRYQPRLVMGFDNLAGATLIAAIPTLYALGSLQLNTITAEQAPAPLNLVPNWTAELRRRK
jgi:hypothetical protein